MHENKISSLSSSLLWLGAAISIAEIMTGALLAPLGLGLGVAAIVTGHFIGCILLYFAGLIGANTKMSAMESVGLSFGRYGSIFFSVLNILQLVGWTAVMILNGANALGSIVNGRFGFSGNILCCAVIGTLIIVWIMAGLKNIVKLNIFAVGALFILIAILGVTVFKGGDISISSEMMRFGLALELSIAMPISWLPLISDYTKSTDKPIKFTLVSTFWYFLGSCTMYIIGLGAALFTGSSDVVKILMNAGLGMTAIWIVILSTVTTTFLDVYSAGESVINIRPTWNGKLIGAMICIIGTLIAIFIPVAQYENFLYLIGSVFIPMATIMIMDYFVLKKRETVQKINVLNTCLWLVGFIIYRVFLHIDTILGSTVPVVFIIIALCFFINKLGNRKIEKVVDKHV